MNLLELICKELGVEVGEIWLGNNGYEYTITNLGELYNRDLATFDDISVVLTGELKPVWKPDSGDIYYYPNPVHSYPDGKEEHKCGFVRWDNDFYDEYRLKNNLVYKTKEEAIAAANKMLEAIKEED